MNNEFETKKFFLRLQFGHVSFCHNRWCAYCNALNSYRRFTLFQSNRISASDRDLGINADIAYFINGTERDEFLVDDHTGVLRTRSIPLPTIDYEQVKNYTFNIYAIDQFGHGLVGMAKVMIDVIDANDNVPVFQPKYVSTSVSEDVSMGTSVAKVTASDPDTDLNGRVSYSIISGAEGKFEIDRVDGTIRVSGKLDREMASSYTLNISALDGSWTPLEGFGTVYVALEDVNDNIPVFQQGVYNVEISESSPIGTRVLNVTAMDSDSGLNSKITYSISTTDFIIDSETGVIKTNINLDRENKDAYSFDVTASDGPGLTSRVTVNIAILDENDNAPVFPTSTYKTDILDKTPVGSIILTVVADDRDINQNARIQYTIIEDTAKLFEIGQTSGLIR